MDPVPAMPSDREHRTSQGWGPREDLAGRGWGGAPERGERGGAPPFPARPGGRRATGSPPAPVAPLPGSGSVSRGRAAESGPGPEPHPPAVFGSCPAAPAAARKRRKEAEGARSRLQRNKRLLTRPRAAQSQEATEKGNRGGSWDVRGAPLGSGLLTASYAPPVPVPLPPPPPSCAGFAP